MNFIFEGIAGIQAEFLAPVIVSLGFIAIPIIGILTRHQRKMAEIIHGLHQDENMRAELEEVKSEVRELRSQLRSLNSQNPATTGTDELTRRLG